MSTKNKVTYATRDETPVESAVKAEWQAAEGMLEQLAASEDVAENVPELAGAIFCGHLVADLDSVAGAIGAAHLYGGVPARASEMNSETEFALEHWGISLDTIRPVEALLEERGPKAPVCLVDFQQTTQLNGAIKENQIVGIIDHHALQSSTIVTSKPIFVDIRPWGSMSSIIAHSFVMLKRTLPKSIAGLLLCAILSDTLNLRSPTTTSWDRKIVSMLVQYTGVEDVNLLCAQQFKAKSRSLGLMTAQQLCSGDLKQFKLGKGETPVRVAFAVVETTDANAMIARTGELVEEVVALKVEMVAKSGIDCMFLALVDIVELRTHLVVAGEKERSLAAAAGFNAEALSADVAKLAGAASKYLYCMAPGQVSRKADFIPPLTDAVESGWSPSAVLATRSELDLTQLAAQSALTVEYSASSPSGKLVRVKSGLESVSGLEAVPPTPATTEAVASVGGKRKACE